LFAWPDLVIPLLPVQLLWINLVLDGIPAIALGVDRAPGDPLASPPSRGGLLTGVVLGRSVVRARGGWGLAAAAVEVARSLGAERARGELLAAPPSRGGRLTGVVLGRIVVRALVVGVLAFAAVEVARSLGR